jgi:hypothetical protein
MSTATMRRRIDRLEENMSGGEAGWGEAVEWAARFRQGHSESDPAYFDFCRRWAASPRCQAIDAIIRQTLAIRNNCAPQSH